MVQSMAFFSPCGKLTKSSERFGHSILACRVVLQQRFYAQNAVWTPISEIGNDVLDPTDRVDIRC